MLKLSTFNSRRDWLWPIAVYAANLSILWMISFVTTCTEPGVTPEVCEAVRPSSSLYPLMLIAVAVSFPPIIVLLGLLQMRRVSLCLIYAGFASVVTLVTFELYRRGYFVPGPVRATSYAAGCVMCDAIFIVQIAFNLGWVYAVVPAGLINSYASMLHSGKKK